MQTKTSLFLCIFNSPSLGVWWGIQAWMFMPEKNSLICFILSITLSLVGLTAIYLRSRQGSKNRPLWIVLNLLTTAAIILEINNMSKFKNPWSAQSSTLVLLWEYSQTLKFCEGKKRFLLLSINLYSFVRLLIEAFQDSNIFTLESLQIIGLCTIQTIQYENEIYKSHSGQVEYGQHDDLSISRAHRDIPEIKQMITIKIADVSSSIKDKSLVSKIRQYQPVNTMDKQNQQVSLFLQNLMNKIPEGIIIIDGKEHLAYMNNKVEKMLDCTEANKVMEKLKHMLLKGQIMPLPKNAYQDPNNSSKFIEESIRQCQQNDDSEQLIKILLQRPFAGSSFNSPKSKNHPRQMNEIFENESVQQNLITFNFKMENLALQKQFKIRVLNISLMSGDMDPELMLNSAHNKPALLVLVKNVSTKAKLRSLRSECDFQNQLLQSFSHELRTPLNCSNQILGVALELISDTSLRKLILQAAASNTLLIYQINDILDFAAMECSKFYYKWSWVSIQSVFDELREIYTDACNEKLLTLSMSNQSSTTSLKTDRSRLMQILVNLINNSLKFTRQYGFITIRVETKTSQIVKFQVIDSGFGINEKTLGLIRQRAKSKEKLISGLIESYQNGKRGLGFDLSNKLVQGLTFSRENYLKINSTEGRGTQITFYVENKTNDMIGSDQSQNKQLFGNTKLSSGVEPEELQPALPINQHINRFPSVDESYEPPRDSTNNINFRIPYHPDIFHKMTGLRSQASLKSSKVGSLKGNLFTATLTKHLKVTPCKDCVQILIVDDVPFNHIALKAVLEKLDLACDSAYEGFQALDLVKNFINNHCKSYRLILMDIEMPNMSGFETSSRITQFLNSNGLSSNIIMCSAYDTTDNQMKAEQCGMIDILPKPVRKNDIVQILEKYYYN